MIVATLLSVLGIFALCQPTAGRHRAALLFALPTLMFTMTSDRLDDQWYYMGAALTDSLTIILLSCLVATDKLTVQLMVFSALSMCFNLVGLVMYETYHSPTIYNALFIALYTGVIIALADRRGGSDVGMDKHGGGCPSRRRNDNSGSPIDRQGGTKI